MSWRLPRRRCFPPDEERARHRLVAGGSARTDDTGVRAGSADGEAGARERFAPRDSATRTSTGAGSRASSRWTSGRTTPARSSRADSLVSLASAARSSPSLRAQLLGRAPTLPRRVRRRRAARRGGRGDRPDATRIPPPAGFAVLHAAWRGERERTEALRAATIEAGTARAEGFAVEVAEWAAAVLHNGLGEYEEAQAAAERAYEHDGLGFGVWVLPELIEAAVRSGDRPAAELAYERLDARSSTSTTEWARGIEAAAACHAQRRAPSRRALRRSDRPTRSIPRHRLHTRAQLTYGEWLRREGRRVDARAQLKAALSAFETMGQTRGTRQRRGRSSHIARVTVWT